MTRAALLIALLPMAALAQSSTAKEQALGKQLAQDVERTATLLVDPTILQYVNRVAQRVAQAAGLADPLTVKVIDGDRPYAQAYPGASLYVNTNLILTAATEAELAGAIAHQLGHIALWHDKQPARADPLNIAQIPILWYARCVRGGGGFGLAAFSTQQAALESEADQLGLTYMDKAGYDPGALADIYERILAQEVRKPLVFQSWLKFPAATRTQADAMRNQHADYIVTTSEFLAIQHRLSGLLRPPPADAPTLNPRMRAAQSLKHERTVIPDTIIVDYLNRISWKLSTSSALKTLLTVKVIASDDARAITLPEGITYLSTQLIRTATSESELAAAIAHQLGHLADPQLKVAGASGLCERAQGAIVLDPAAETQADRKALDYLDKAGYDPGALADLYERIAQPFPKSTRARADALRNGRASVVDTSEFKAVQQRLIAIAH